MTRKRQNRPRPTNQEEFERLADELAPDPAQRHTIAHLTQELTRLACTAAIDAQRGDADEVIRGVTIVAAHCYQIALQLGGNLDDELDRFRRDTRLAAAREYARRYKQHLRALAARANARAEGT